MEEEEAANEVPSPDTDPVPPDPRSGGGGGGGLGVESTCKRRMRSILLVPTITFSVRPPGIINELRGLTAFIDERIAEYDRCLAEMSAMVFSANNLQNRLIPTEFSVELLRIYEHLSAENHHDFNVKLDRLAQTDDRIMEEKNRLNDAFDRWDNFLAKIDAGIEKALGPYKPQHENKDTSGLEASPCNEVSWLLPYLNDSAFDRSLISIVSNFNSNQCAEYVLSLYEKILDFQDYGCDVILLKRGPGTKGGGYLKLVGVPFRVLLDEQESQARLLCARQSAVALAGKQALHQLVEVSHTNEALDSLVAKTPEAIGEVVMMRIGDVTPLYRHLVMQDTDWPSVDELLQKAKNDCEDDRPRSKKSSDRTGSAVQNSQPGENQEKRGCCSIL